MSSELDTTAFKPFNRPGNEPFERPTGNIHAHGLTQYSSMAAEAFSLPLELESKHHTPPLFLTPKPPLTYIFPHRWPGITSESTNMLLKLLEDNHRRWHVYFNYVGFHNHASHHLLAIWAMGASANIISSAYETHCEYQRPAFESPSHITSRNFNEHLGDERFYSAYLDFFECEIGKKGLGITLEECIFAPSANFQLEKELEKEGHPEMLSRFLSGVLHAVIHTGLGAEFKILGLSAEGMAVTAVQPTEVHDLLPPSYFTSPVKSGTLHALSILALVAKDEKFDGIKKTDDTDMLVKIMSSHSEAIRAYAEMWRMDFEDEELTAKAVEELTWVNSMIYGIGGATGRKDDKKAFNADFFLMHLVTSSLFLPSLVASLYHSNSKALLLRSYFAMSLALYLQRGRPSIDVAKFYNATSWLFDPASSGQDLIPGPQPSPSKNTLPNPESAEARTPNSWLSVVQTTLVHPNEHLCKAQRALAHFASSYGLREKGWFFSQRGQQEQVDKNKLEDAERSVGLGELDGTFFLRVAMLTAHRLGWMREGESGKQWDFEGFYEA